jgi:hypothetical protein
MMHGTIDIKLKFIRVNKSLGTEIRIASKNYTTILHIALRAVDTVHIGKNVKQILCCLQVLYIRPKSRNRIEDTYIFGEV